VMFTTPRVDGSSQRPAGFAWSVNASGLEQSDYTTE